MPLAVGAGRAVDGGQRLHDLRQDVAVDVGDGLGWCSSGAESYHSCDGRRERRRYFGMVQSPSVSLALAAGFVSFVSPCCLPLVPGYLAAISGGTAFEPGSRPSAGLMVRALVFVGTFSLVFILLGLSATALGSLLQGHQILLRQIAGIAIVAMGVLFLASAFVLRLNQDWHPGGLIERAGRGGPVIAGLAFAIAWTPCVGPTLGAILGLASTQQSTAQGALLLAFYSLGLAVPFLHLGPRLRLGAALVRVDPEALRRDPGGLRRDPDRDGRPGFHQRAVPVEPRSPAAARGPGTELLPIGLEGRVR